MRHHRTILILFLGSLCTLAYLPSLGGPLLQFDDTMLISENPQVRAGAQGLVEIWKGHSLDYYPLSLTLFWIEWHAGGGLPQIFRVVNLALHLIAAGLLAYLLSMWLPGRRRSCRADPSAGDERFGRTLAFPTERGALIWFIVALWMLHPLSVASVAWVSEQKNTLSAVFALASAIAFTRSLISNRPAPYILALLLFALSLLAKAAFVGLPLILLVMIWWRLGRVPKREVIRLAPMLALSIVFSITAIWFQARHVAQIGNDAGPILIRVVRAGWAAWFYLWKMIAPIRLTPIYPRWRVDPTNPLHWLPLIALIAVIAAILMSRRRGWIVMMLAGLLLLAPIIGLANSSFFRLSYVADHWTYPALMVFAVAVGCALARSPRKTQTSVAIVAVVILLPLTWRRAAVYHDTLSLWEDAVRKNPTSYAIYTNLAWAYVDANELPQALIAAEHAAQLAPDEPDVQQTLAAVRRRAEAEDHTPK